MFIQRKDQRIVTIALMMAAITFLNYFALYTLNYEHALYRSLFYLPLVLETVALARQDATDRGVELILALALHLPALSGGYNKLKQVILNLITNAVQASSKGDRVKVFTHLADRWNIVLDVVDAGCGIGKKGREKIFLPLYSSKSEGTGLGLPIVKKIVEAHGGDIHFYPNKGKGVTFRVQLSLLSAGA